MRGFGDLEAAIMAWLWDHGDAASGNDLFDSLVPDHDVAYTTVTRALDNLQRRGWLTRHRRGRAFVYKPTVTRAKYSADVMREALQESGQSDAVLTHFVEQMSPGDAAALHSALLKLTGGETSE